MGVYTVSDTSETNVNLVPITTNEWGIYLENSSTSTCHYIHAWNHSGSASTGSITCLYLPYNNDHSGWYLIRVDSTVVAEHSPDEEAQRLEKYAKTLVDSLNTLADSIANNITLSIDVDTTGMTNVTPTLEQEQENMFADVFSNAGMSVENGYNWGSDGNGFTGLLDDDHTTYFHTTYNAQPEWTDYAIDGTGYGYRTSKHTLGFKLTQDVNNILFIWTERDGWDDCPVKFDVEASNDGTTWTPVTYGYKFYSHGVANGVKVNVGPIQLGNTYRYVRILTDGCSRGHFFNLGGIRVYTGAKYAANSRASMAGEAFTNLLNAYSNADLIARSDSVDNIENLENAITTLMAAYDTFVASTVDPAKLKEACEKAKSLLDGFMIDETLLGTYTEDADTTNLHGLYTDAINSLATGNYTKDYVENTSESILAAIDELNTHFVTPDTNKIYRIKSATSEELDEGKIDFSSDVVYIKDRVISVAQDYNSTDTIVITFDAIEDATLSTGKFYSIPAEQADDIPELTYFRFIALGDSGYAIQNIGTGLYMPELVQSSLALTSLQPGVFTMEPMGYGFVCMHSRSIFDGTDNNQCIHIGAPSAGMKIVGYYDNVIGSKSCIHIEEVGNLDDVEISQVRAVGDMQFVMPTTLSDFDGATAYTAIGKTVTEDGTTYIAMKSTSTVEAGQPTIIISDNDEDPYLFTAGLPFSNTLATESAVTGVFKSTSIPSGSAKLNYDSDTGYFWKVMATSGLTASDNEIYIDIPKLDSLPDVQEDEAELLVPIQGFNYTGINTATTGKSLKSDDIYTIDGIKLNKSIDQLSRGLYIIGGKKVYVP